MSSSKSHCHPISYSILLVVILACGGTKQSTRTASDHVSNGSLQAGLEAYRARNYELALTHLDQVVRHPQSTTEQKTQAHKVRAFIYALQENAKASQDEFLQAFTLDREFSLDKAEVGNPFWMPPYEAASDLARLLYASPGELTARGVHAYLQRDYAAAMQAFDAALEKKSIVDRDKITCYKHIAFIHALHNRSQEAKQAFRAAFRTDRRFALDKGEYGNPSWTPIYEEVLKEMKK